ncbi:hypothetical protein [Salibaculum halophilum]|uniref:hypothetical protein n=1 Tax=Salibaculum halophilum TaxID=1914408 RepID=UPI000A0F9EC6|nr:hypothetical protein [Salibaculum halophilum]
MTPRPILICALLGAAPPQIGAAETRAALDTTAAADQVCVGNRTDEPFLFAAQAPGGTRVVETLRPGEVLCSEGTGSGRGVVSVYEGADALEGCSRLVAPGRTEALLRYVDFDRCAWTSNS